MGSLPAPYTPIVPDYSWIATAAQQLGQTIANIPGVVQASRLIRENKVNKKELYQGVRDNIASLPDDVLAAMNTSKAKLLETVPRPGGPNTEPLDAYVKKVGAWYIPLVNDLKTRGNMDPAALRDRLSSLPGALQKQEDLAKFAAGVSTDLTQKGITGASQRAAGPNEQAAFAAANARLTAPGQPGDEPFNPQYMDPAALARVKARATKQEANAPGVAPPATREEYQRRLAGELAQMPGGSPTQQQVEANPVATAREVAFPTQQQLAEQQKTLAEANKANAEAAGGGMTPYQAAQLGQAADREYTDRIAAAQKRVDSFDELDTKNLNNATAIEGRIADYKALEKKIQSGQSDSYDLNKWIRENGTLEALQAQKNANKVEKAKLARSRREAEAEFSQIKKSQRLSAGQAAVAGAKQAAQQVEQDAQSLLNQTAPDGRTFAQLYAAGPTDGYKALQDYGDANGIPADVVEHAIQTLKGGGKRSAAPKKSRTFEELDTQYGR